MLSRPGPGVAGFSYLANRRIGILRRPPPRPRFLTAMTPHSRLTGTDTGGVLDRAQFESHRELADRWPVPAQHSVLAR